VAHEHDPAADRKTYFFVWLLLVVLTVVTVAVTKLDFGQTGDIVVAMIIASVKATAVALFFMHLKHEDPLTWVYASYPLILMALLVVSSVADDKVRRPAMVEHEFSIPELHDDGPTHGAPKDQDGAHGNGHE